MSTLPFICTRQAVTFAKLSILTCRMVIVTVTTHQCTWLLAMQWNLFFGLLAFFYWYCLNKLLRSFFFQNICKPASCLHHLLPQPRNTYAISKLRSCTPLPHPISWTKKYESFVNQQILMPSVSQVFVNALCDYQCYHHFYRTMHFSAKRSIAIACRLSVCL